MAATQSGAAASGLDIQIVGSDTNSLRAANKMILDFLSGDKAKELNISNVTASLADVKPALQNNVTLRKPSCTVRPRPKLPPRLGAS